ncbi:hypothetical protein HaLaN_22560, partial [Haematococcus lacustris]
MTRIKTKRSSLTKRFNNNINTSGRALISQRRNVKCVNVNAPSRIYTGNLGHGVRVRHGVEAFPRIVHNSMAASAPAVYISGNEIVWVGLDKDIPPAYLTAVTHSLEGCVMLPEPDALHRTRQAAARLAEDPVPPLGEDD